MSTICRASLIVSLLLISCQNQHELANTSLVSAFEQLNGGAYNGEILHSIISNADPISGDTMSIRSVLVDGSNLTFLIGEKNTVVSDKELKGAEINISIPNPYSREPIDYVLRIDDISLDTTTSARDVWLYDIKMKREGDSKWSRFCNDYMGKPAFAIPIQGAYWNETTGERVDKPNAIMFACTNGAIGKCIKFGYRPWAHATECQGHRSEKTCKNVSLKEYHQACTRMIRADYCGDGVGHTTDGTLLDIYDRYIEPPIQAREKDWPIEAYWSPKGAICVSTRRHPEIDFSGKCIRNGKSIQLPKCASSIEESDQALLVNTVGVQ